MKKCDAYFTWHNIMREAPSGVSFPNSYDFWKPLLERFIPRCDSFQIRCRVDDLESLASAMKYGAPDEEAVDGTKKSSIREN